MSAQLPSILAADCARRAKNASRREPTTHRFVSLPFGFFEKLWNFVFLFPGRRIDVSRGKPQTEQAGMTLAAEGRVLVASTTERNVTGGDRKDVGTTTPDSGVKGNVARKKRSSAAKDEGQVANALRSVYQRAVDEDIPSEMLDLLSKLD
jgi:hypothetical protein